MRAVRLRQPSQGVWQPLQRGRRRVRRALSTAAVAAPQDRFPACPEVATHGMFAGGVVLPFTEGLHLVSAEASPRWPVYRVMEPDGLIRPGAAEPELSREVALKMYGDMIKLRVMDYLLYNAQRQGRISFYMTSTGEEAAQIGSAAALDDKDMVFGQYREPGVLIWRGFQLQEFTDQCFSNRDDLGKGRQMPVHYGSRALHYQTISSPLGTQIPQAAGAAYAQKISGSPNICMCYFGDGAASEGDFHAALNFASVLESPVIFFCKNNGYAISTPTKDQYRGDGIVSRATGYGIHGIRVDGNDPLAVYQATAAARRLCVTEKRPVLIEAMTYRVGHHSTSDDWSRYRGAPEVQRWRDLDDPLVRFRRYLENKEWMDESTDTALKDEQRALVMQAFEAAEAKAKPSVDTMFDDVYKEMPPHLQEQKRQMEEHIAKYADHYKSSSVGKH